MSNEDDRPRVKVPVLKLLNLFRKYKAGKLTLLGFIIALLLAIVGASACTQPDTEGCIHWRAQWEATNR